MDGRWGTGTLKMKSWSQTLCEVLSMERGEAKAQTQVSDPGACHFAMFLLASQGACGFQRQ